MPLAPIMPHGNHLGELKDLAQDVIMASASLEGRVAPKTARVLGGHLRLLNSYYSNLIEGHRTYIPDIQRALDGNFDHDEGKRYSQTLCAAHVLAERELMDEVGENKGLNVSSPVFVSKIHETFYSHLPEEHQFCHDANGFNDHLVMPGVFRDVEVALRADGAPHGPRPDSVMAEMGDFGKTYDPHSFHGDERLIAMAVSHHRLAYIHPFRDGNGRVCRLHSGLFMAASKFNRANLWSLSRGLSRVKDEYMVELYSVDPGPDDLEEDLNERLADYCWFFLDVCKDQIQFMSQLLRLEEVESRIEHYVKTRSEWKTRAFRNVALLLRALFMRGEVPRGEVPTLLNTSETSARRVVKNLQERGLMASAGGRAPWQASLPMKAMPYYFPSLFRPELLGDEYIAMLQESE